MTFQKHPTMNIVKLNTTITTNLPCIQQIISRSYAFKSDLKIKWVRPEKIPCYKPEKSGDLEGMPQIDKTQPILEFRESKELKTADETVKKLFSLEFAPKNYTNRLYVHDLASTVKRHEYDVATVELKIAKWTGNVRALQEVMERFPRDKILKVKLKELIDKRKKQLKYLRRWDYKRFEWLLESLNLVYKAPPSEFRWVTRKESLVKLTNQYCEDLKKEKLNVLRKHLENEQPAFLEEKLRALQYIRDEQRGCGVEVTVSDGEINAVKQQLNELLEKKKKENEENE